MTHFALGRATLTCSIGWPPSFAVERGVTIAGDPWFAVLIGPLALGFGWRRA